MYFHTKCWVHGALLLWKGRHFLEQFRSPWQEWARTILSGLKTNPMTDRQTDLGFLWEQVQRRLSAGGHCHAVGQTQFLSLALSGISSHCWLLCNFSGNFIHLFLWWLLFYLNFTECYLSQCPVQLKPQILTCIYSATVDLGASTVWVSIITNTALKPFFLQKLQTAKFTVFLVFPVM